MDRKALSRAGIYKIESVESGRVYIGSAGNIHRRWLQHRTRLSRRVHHSIKLQRAWLKYGPDGFRFEVVEFVENESDLLAREQHWLDATEAAKTGYNVCAEAGRTTGVTKTAEQRARHSALMKGRTVSDEARRNMSAALMGHKHSAETIEKIAKLARERGLSDAQREAIKKANTGRKWTPELREKMKTARKPWTDEMRAAASERAKGRTHTAESKAKIAENNRVRVISPETIERMSQAQRGKTYSKETKAKVSAAGMGRIITPETRARLVAAQLLRRANERAARDSEAREETTG